MSKYAKGQIIYTGTADALYLLVSGRVKVLKLTSGDRELVARVVPVGRLFGEPSLIGGSPAEQAARTRGASPPRDGEHAVAIQSLHIDCAGVDSVV